MLNVFVLTMILGHSEGGVAIHTHEYNRLDDCDNAAQMFESKAKRSGAIVRPIAWCTLKRGEIQ